jgi:acetyl-CoA synthetase
VSAIVTDAANYAKAAEARTTVDTVRQIYLIDGADRDALDLRVVLARASDRFSTVDTLAEDPAFISYTSGTTGWPKGALHVHRVMLGHVPGNEFYYDFFPQPGDRMWSPADWAWIAGLFDVLMPALYFGVPVVSFRARKFDPDQAWHMMGKHAVRTAFLTPTTLKLMRQVRDGATRSGTKLRAVMSGSESVGRELLEWASTELGVRVNEGFGQTECNLVIGNCSSIMPVKPGSLGRAVPGHVAAIVNDAGEIGRAGETGHIAIKRPDPVMMKEYWRNPEATAKKFAGDWLLTGDLGHADDDGYLWYQGRADDVITSSGYRIGPGEIEDALVRHEAVLMAAAIGVPDPLRTETIKAFVILREGHVGGEALAKTIMDFVGDRLARHERPREIAFVDSLPMTTTGKIMRKTLREQEIARTQTA